MDSTLAHAVKSRDMVKTTLVAHAVITKRQMASSRLRVVLGTGDFARPGGNLAQGQAVRVHESLHVESAERFSPPLLPLALFQSHEILQAFLARGYTDVDTALM